MHIAILMTNTDESDFAARHPRDGEKFANLIKGLRPDWQTSVYAVKDGIFPPPRARHDGWIITGSPASVHDTDPWIERLMLLIRDIVADGAPLFGACFGHQAIATALGGQVGKNPGGWVFGATDTTHKPTAWIDQPGPIRLYAAHVEQVTALPPGAVALAGNADCPVGSFAIGNSVFTTQYHPEMTPAFIAALTDHLGNDLPPDVIRRARASLAEPAETARIAGWIIAFFEQAYASAASKSIAVT